MIGGTGGSTLSFLTNRYTWADLTHMEPHRVQAIMMTAQTAAINSEKEMRVVIISPALNNTQENLINKHKHEKVKTSLNMIHIPIGGLRMENINIHLRRTQAGQNTQPIVISMIENRKTKPFNYEELKQDIIKENIQITEHKTIRPNNPRTPSTKTHPKTHRRTDIRKYKSLIWFRNDFPRPEDIKESMTKTETANPLLGCIGIMPINIKKDLIHMGHDHDTITDEIITKIQKIIINTSLESYMRYESWRKRKKPPS